MNIWYVHPYGGGPGIGRFFRPWHFAKEWQLSGHTVDVFIARYHHLLDRKEPLPPEIDVEGARYHSLMARTYVGNGLSRILNMWDFSWSLWGMRHRIDKDLPSPDVIIVSSPHPFVIYPAKALARRTGAKLVFEVRDLWPLSITEINKTSPWHPFVMLVAMTERYAYRHADLVASLLPGVEDYMKERKLAYQKFVCVPNGFESGTAQSVAPTSAEGRRAMDVITAWKKQGIKILVHPGAMGPPNALDVLLRGIEQYRKKKSAPPIGVLLIGDGSMRPELEAQKELLKLDNVEFTGAVPKAEAQYIVSLCNYGYCGLRDHRQLYRYGISLNKMIDYAQYGLPMLLPSQAKLNTAFANSPLVVQSPATPDGIADMLVQLVNAKIDHQEAERIKQELSYTRLAGTYIDALGLPAATL
jgi:glycosyltransferase involved in cell wall biosynthesis